MSRGRRKELTLRDLTFGDAAVMVPETADIAPVFYQGEEYVELLQDALDELHDEWQEATGRARSRLWPARNNGPDLTLVLEPDDPVMHVSVVPVFPRETRRWALYAHHTARHREPSPFVYRPKGGPEAESLTIKLAGTPEQPSLVRAYPGDYQPPLPWMASAKDTPGGIRAAREYWASHAYVEADDVMKGHTWTTAPVWFSDFGRYVANRADRARRSRQGRR